MASKKSSRQIPGKEKKKEIATRVGVRKKFTFTGLDGKEYTLTEQQKLFCEIYIQPFMSGTQAVIEAGYGVYDNKGKLNRNLARSMAAENLAKPAICQYITLLLDDAGLNDQIVDKHLLYNITQYFDLKAKNTAIEIYNKLKRRYGNTPGDPSIAAPQTEREAELTAVLLKKYHDLKQNQSDSSLADSSDS